LSNARSGHRADFSTALISYHFKDREDLMNHTLMTLLENNTAFVLAKTNVAANWRARLRAFILASLE
jgi:TetR/AcrR family transcriptional regulator, transcriptional repressor of bet genes